MSQYFTTFFSFPFHFCINLFLTCIAFQCGNQENLVTLHCIQTKCIVFSSVKTIQLVDSSVRKHYPRSSINTRILKNKTGIRFYPPTRTKHLKHYEYITKVSLSKDLIFHLMYVQKLKKASFSTSNHIKTLLHIACSTT